MSPKKQANKIQIVNDRNDRISIDGLHPFAGKADTIHVKIKRNSKRYKTRINNLESTNMRGVAGKM